MTDMLTTIQKNIFPYLPPALVKVFEGIAVETLKQVNEIRLRINQPLSLVLHSGDILVGKSGQPVQSAAEAYICNRDDLSRTLHMMSRNSLYAFEKELQQGFLTLSGGHRVGLAGQAILENNLVKTLTNISSMNIRLAREVQGCADRLMPYIISGSRICNTLLISPPRCGKTTVLRDIVRQLSAGVPALQFGGSQVGVVDERSEIAACQDGIPSMDLGYRIDVLDGCPKAQGMMMLIRSMAPGVIATDELGREEDATAVQEAIHSGVSVIATVHGRSFNEIMNRPHIGELIVNRWFERYVLLGSRPTPGTIEEISSGSKQGEILYGLKKEVKSCG